MPTLVALCSLAFAGNVISLMPGQDPSDPLNAAYVFVDESSRLDISEVMQRDADFTRNTAWIINPGITRGVVWIRFDACNRAERAGEWVVSLNRALLDPGEIYLVTTDQTQTLLANSASAFSGSYAAFGTLAAGFELAAQSPARIYIRYRGGNWSGMVPSITTPETLREQVSRKLLIVSAIIGGVMTLVVYVFVSFLLIGRHIALLYAVGQTAFLIFYLHFTGFTTVYLWPQDPHMGRWVAPLALGIYVMATLQFARRFFSSEIRLPRLDRWMLALLIAMLCAVVMLCVSDVLGGVPRQVWLFLIYLVTALSWITMASLAVYATTRWDRDLWPLALSWSWVLVFIIGILSVFVGALRFFPFEQHSYAIFVYPEALFMAVAIALRARQIRTQREIAEKRLNESLVSELNAIQRAVRFSEEREWALRDLAEKGRLILAAGHDASQMISSLRHYALGLRRASRPERVIEVAAAMEQIAAHLDEVLGAAIHGSASGGIGDRSVALEEVTPAQIIAPLKLIYASVAAKKSIDLRLRMTTTPLVTDRVLVARILSNLISNALRYTDSGRVLVACRAHAGVHRFQVFDSGHGLKPEAVEGLLHADAGAVQFGHDSTGHGVGLVLVKALANRVGGSLHVSSALGRGSLFELRLTAPAARSSSAEVVRLIVLDHENRIPDSLLKALSEQRFEVTFTTIAEEARRYADDPRALVLVDDYFGGAGSGIDLAEELMREARGATIAIMTHDRSIEGRTRAANACHVILYKPLSLGLFLTAASSASGIGAGRPARVVENIGS